MKVLTCQDAQQPTDGPVRTRRRQRHPHSLPAPWGVAKTCGRSLPVLAQLLRLLMGTFADKHHPATARAQLQKELKVAVTAVTAAQLEGGHSLSAATIMQHLPPARLQQLLTAATAAAAKRRQTTRGTAGGSCGHACQVAGRAQSSSAAGGSDASTATSSDGHVPRASCAPAAQATHQLHLTGAAGHGQQQPSTADRLLPSQQAIWDVGCLLETTLVAAAAEAQLASVSLDDPGSDCFMDDASSPVDVEGVMLEELELAKFNGLV